MLYDVLELLMNYMQYFFLTVSIDPNAFPSLYSTPFYFLDVIMSLFSRSSLAENTSNSTLRESSGVLSTTRAANPFFGIQLPSWMPLDLRLQFALTNLLSPIAFVVLAALLLGPPLFTVFILVLFMVVFGSVLGSLLLALTHMYPPAPWTELWRIWHSITLRGAIAMTSVCAGIALLLSALCLTVRIVRRRRQRAHVLEQLRRMENTPQTLEEGVVEHVMRAGSTEDDGLRDHNDDQQQSSHNNQDANGDAEEWGPDQVRCAKTELAYRRMQCQRYRDTHAFSLFWTTLKFGMAATCIGAAFVIAWAKSEHAQKLIENRTVYVFIMAVLFALAVLLITSAVLGFTQTGRQRLYDIKLWLNHILILCGLLIVSFMYAPILRNTINLFPCHTMCEGQAVMNTSNRESNRSNVSCGVSVLSADPRVPCADVNAFLSASAILTGVTYVIFFVLLYAFLTWRALGALERYPLVPMSGAGSNTDARTTHCTVGKALREPTVDRSPLSQTHEPGSFERKKKQNTLRMYYERVRLSDNAAQFLYFPYTYRFRYFKLLVLGQKTAMVIISSMLRVSTGVARPWAGFTACVLLHTGMTIILILCRPYAVPLEFVLSLALQLVLIVVAGMGIAGSVASKPVPEEVYSLVTVSLLSVPCVAVALGVLLTIRKRAGWSLSSFRTWKRWLGSKFVFTKSPWYEQYGQDNSGDNKALFAPALFFKNYKKNSNTAAREERGDTVCNSSQSRRQRKIFCTESHEDNAAVLKGTATFNYSYSMALTMQNFGGPLQSKNFRRKRAQQNWSTLRVAVLAGRYGRLRPRRSQPRCHTHLSSWRAPSISFATPHRVDENDFHHIAVTALLTSVVHASRWEAPGSIRRDGEGEAMPLNCLLPSPNLPRRYVRRQEVFLERVQTILARQRLRALYGSRKRHIHQQQRAVDCLINAKVVRTMRHLVLALGVSAAVAAALFFAAVLQSEGNVVQQSLHLL